MVITLILLNVLQVNLLRHRLFIYSSISWYSELISQIIHIYCICFFVLINLNRTLILSRLSDLSRLSRHILLPGSIVIRQILSYEVVPTMIILLFFGSHPCQITQI